MTILKLFLVINWNLNNTLKDGCVEHDPQEITTVLQTTQMQLKKQKLSQQILGIGITNQRETVVIWDKQTGKPIYKAIVWQDRRTVNYCKI